MDPARTVRLRSTDWCWGLAVDPATDRLLISASPPYDFQADLPGDNPHVARRGQLLEVEERPRPGRWDYEVRAAVSGLTRPGGLAVAPSTHPLAGAVFVTEHGGRAEIFFSEKSDTAVAASTDYPRRGHGAAAIGLRGLPPRGITRRPRRYGVGGAPGRVLACARDAGGQLRANVYVDFARVRAPRGNRDVRERARSGHDGGAMPAGSARRARRDGDAPRRSRGPPTTRRRRTSSTPGRSPSRRAATRSTWPRTRTTAPSTASTPRARSCPPPRPPTRRPTSCSASRGRRHDHRPPRRGDAATRGRRVVSFTAHSPSRGLGVAAAPPPRA